MSAGFFGCTLEMFNGCQRKRLFLHGRYHSIHNFYYTLINNSFWLYNVVSMVTITRGELKYHFSHVSAVLLIQV